MMRALSFVLALAAAHAAAADPSYHLDTTRWFASADAEAALRVPLLARQDAFAAASSTPPASASDLLALLRNDDALRRELRLHALYVHLRAADDTGDHAAATAATADAALTPAHRRARRADIRRRSGRRPRRGSEVARRRSPAQFSDHT